MRKTILRRLEALEVDNRARDEKEQSLLRSGFMSVKMVVLAYYLGDLNPDERTPYDAYIRALKYLSSEEYGEDLFCRKGTGDYRRIRKRENDAYHRLFAKVGLDFDTTSPTALFDAFVIMVDQLPDRWLTWLRSEREFGSWEFVIPLGAKLPRHLSAENFVALCRG